MSLIDSSRIEGLLDRVQALEAGTRPRWGRMTPARMLDHLGNSLEIGLGLRQAAPLVPDWLAALLRPACLLPLPIPRRLPSTAEFLTPCSPDLGQARDRFGELLRRFHREVLGNPAARHRHPIFGLLDRRQWAGLQARHIEHHFRQFGL
jgi:hypothetical protein